MTTHNTESAIVLWVCTDCAQESANGEHSPDAECEPWSLWSPQDEITMGMLYSEHSCESPGEVECECETKFSLLDCDGCGSTLGGQRHAFTAWFQFSITA